MCHGGGMIFGFVKPGKLLTAEKRCFGGSDNRVDIWHGTCYNEAVIELPLQKVARKFLTKNE
jgi:hypothetical protein